MFDDSLEPSSSAFVAKTFFHHKPWNGIYLLHLTSLWLLIRLDPNASALLLSSTVSLEFEISPVKVCQELSDWIRHENWLLPFKEGYLNSFCTAMKSEAVVSNIGQRGRYPKVRSNRDLFKEGRMFLMRWDLLFRRVGAFINNSQRLFSAGHMNQWSASLKMTLIV